MTAKHTPIVSDGERIRLEDGTLIATVWQQYPSKDRLEGESWIEMMARTESAREGSKQQAIDLARLMASAPDLLEALDMIHKSFGGGNVITFSEADIEQIGAAIAKATGAA